MKPNWKLCMRISGKHGQSMHRDEAMGVQMEKTWTRRETKTGEARISNVDASWFIDGDPREFKSEAEMMAAIESKNH